MSTKSSNAYYDFILTYSLIVSSRLPAMDLLLSSLARGARDIVAK